MAEGFFSKIFTEDFRSKPIAKYAAIGVAIFFVLIIGLKLTAKSSPGLDTAGFYILYIPLWLIFSIVILQLLSQIANLLRIGLVILFFVGLFMIFVADSPVEGIMALGPVGIVIIAILNFIITSLAISLVPGILAGLAVGALLGGDSSLAVILGLVAFVVVTAAIFNFIWRWLIPFAIGFSISLLVGKIVAAMVGVLFSSYQLEIPDISTFMSRISDLDFSKMSRSVQVVSKSAEALGESLKIFWQRYPLIFIGAVIFGIVFAAVLGGEEQ